MSMTSPSRRRTPAGRSCRYSAATSPAAAGVVAYTAEWILTPAGTPMTGTRSPTALQMLRAVPSPPAKRMRSTPAASRSRAACSVSAGVVSTKSSQAMATGSPPVALELAEHVGAAAVERAEHARLEAGGARLVLAHLAGPGDDLDVVAHAGEALERQPRAPRRVAHGAPLERRAQDLGAVAALEAHAAADAGDGIDDEAELLHAGVTARSDASAVLLAALALPRLALEPRRGRRARRRRRSGRRGPSPPRRTRRGAAR